jgi:hypothetical protein
LKNCNQGNETKEQWAPDVSQKKLQISIAWYLSINEKEILSNSFILVVLLFWKLSNEETPTGRYVVSSMRQNLRWEVDDLSASQGIRRILRNSKVH